MEALIEQRMKRVLRSIEEQIIYGPDYPFLSAHEQWLRRTTHYNKLFDLDSGLLTPVSRYSTQG